MKKASVAIVVLTAVVVMGVFLGCKPKDETPPEISVRVEPTTEYKSEIDGNVIKGVAKVIATATDDVGVEEVIFFVNDQYVWQPVAHSSEDDTTVTVQSDEYIYEWQTQELKDSVVYSIRAAAYDEAGNADTSDALAYLIRIPNDPPNSAYLMTPTNDDTLKQASVILKWQGSDPDKYPKQELNYEVWFGEGSPGNIKLVYETNKGTVPDTGSWGTSQWDKDPPYLRPETHYYWMILTRDPYGQEAESEVFHFERGENTPPSFPQVSSPPDSSNPTIDYPKDGRLKLLWNPFDLDGDALTHTLYFASEDEVDTGRVVVSDLGPPIADSLKAAEYSVTVLHGVAYYWRPISTDYWGAAPDTTNIKAWSFTVAEE